MSSRTTVFSMKQMIWKNFKTRPTGLLLVSISDCVGITVNQNNN